MLKDLFCAIGLGQGGCKMAKEFYNNKYRSFFINTSYQDLEALQVENDLIYHIPASHGCAKNRKRAINYAKNYYETMIGKLLDTHPTARIFLVHFTLGGGTGGGIANIFMALLNQILISKNIDDFMIIPICAKPKKYESYQMQKNAIDSLQEMYKMIDNGVINQYYIINNDSRKDFEEINQENALLFDRWIEGEESNNNSNTDESERMDLFSYKGNAIMFEFSGGDIEEFNENLQMSYNDSIYCKASKKPLAIGLALNENIDEEKALESNTGTFIEKALESIKNTIGYFCNTHITPTKVSNMIIVSGIVDNNSIANEIINIVNREAELINGEQEEQEELVEIEDIKIKEKPKKESKKMNSLKDIMDFF